MQSQVDSLMTREGIEDEARRRGYVSEGDTPVDMSGVDDTGCPSADTTVTLLPGTLDIPFVNGVPFLTGADATESESALLQLMGERELKSA